MLGIFLVVNAAFVAGFPSAGGQLKVFCGHLEGDDFMQALGVFGDGAVVLVDDRELVAGNLGVGGQDVLLDVGELLGQGGGHGDLPVQIRVAQGGEYDEDGNWIESGINSYYNKGKSGTTIYAYLDGTRIVCNLRIDHESYPRLSENDFAEGQRWEVTAYLNPYFDNYQLALLNYTPTNCHLIETSSEAAL